MATNHWIQPPLPPKKMALVPTCCWLLVPCSQFWPRVVGRVHRSGSYAANTKTSPVVNWKRNPEHRWRLPGAVPARKGQCCSVEHSLEPAQSRIGQCASLVQFERHVIWDALRDKCVRNISLPPWWPSEPRDRLPSGS